MDFIELQEKVGKGFNCELLMILCVIAYMLCCHGIRVLTRAVGSARPGLANREHREDSQWAGLFFWPLGSVLSCHWVEIWMLSLDCLHS